MKLHAARAFVILLSVIVLVACGGTDENVGQSVAPLCSSSALTANVDSYRAAPGTAITWTANPACAPGDAPQYRFYMQAPGAPYVLVRDYSSDPTYAWDTSGLAPGAYNWQVWVRSSSGVSYEAYRSRTFHVTGASACTAVSVSSNAQPVHPAGTDVTLSASVSGCPTPEYRWYVRSPGASSWTLARDYGAGTASYTFPTSAGTYDVQVWVRQAGSVGDYEAYASYSLRAQGATVKCTAVTVSHNFAPGVQIWSETAVTMAANATGCTSPEYRWYMRGPGLPNWTVVQDYGASSPQYTVNTQVGLYEFQAWARQAGSSAAYEAYGSYSFTVVQRPVCTALGFTTAPANEAEVGTTVQLMPAPTCPARPFYTLLIRRPGSSQFEVLQDELSSIHGIIWRTENEVPGDYELQLWVWDQSSTREYDVQATIPYKLLPKTPFNECAPADSCLPALPATTPPRPEFTATWSTGATYVLDASASADDDTPFAGLSFRWDFENDGTWDTTWSSDPIATRDFAGTGQRQVSLEVRDSCAQSAAKTRTITVGSTPRYVSGGTLDADTWSGLVVVTGQVTVNSLTVAAGTQVLFTHAPDANGIGTSGLTVGSLTAAGTAEAPIVFSIRGNSARQPRAWKGLVVSDLNSSSGMIIEYAGVGLDAKLTDTASVQNVLVHHSQLGVRVEPVANVAAPSFTGISTRNNVSDGFRLVNMTATLDVETIGNGGTGLVLDDFQGASQNVTVRATNNDAGVRYFAGKEPLTNPADAQLTGNIYNNRRYGLNVDGWKTAIVRDMNIRKNEAGIVVQGCAGLDVSGSHLDHNTAEAVGLAHDPACAGPIPLKVTQGTLACNALRAGVSICGSSTYSPTEGYGMTATNELPFGYVRLSIDSSSGNAKLVAKDGTEVWNTDHVIWPTVWYGADVWAYVGTGSDAVTLQGTGVTPDFYGICRDPIGHKAHVLALTLLNYTPQYGDFSNNYWGGVTPAIFDVNMWRTRTVPALPSDPTLP